MTTLANHALDALLETGALMAEELTELANDIQEASGDAADIAWLRELVRRRETPYRLYHQEITR